MATYRLDFRISLKRDFVFIIDIVELLLGYIDPRLRHEVHLRGKSAEVELEKTVVDLALLKQLVEAINRLIETSRSNLALSIHQIKSASRIS